MLSKRFFIVPARLKGGVSSLIHVSDLGTSQEDQCGESTRLLAGKIIDLDDAHFNGDEAIPDIHLITMAARQCAASEVGHSRDRPTDRPTDRPEKLRFEKELRHLVGRRPGPRALRQHPPSIRVNRDRFFVCRL